VDLLSARLHPHAHVPLDEHLRVAGGLQRELGVTQEGAQARWVGRALVRGRGRGRARVRVRVRVGVRVRVRVRVGVGDTSSR